MVQGLSTQGASGLTLTDALTRENIAKGLVSPTYLPFVSTNFIGPTQVTPVYRGVVQADIVMGRNLAYLSGHYTTPSITSKSSHTTSAHAGTMTSTVEAQAATVAKRSITKVGWVGIVLAGILVFVLVK